MSNQTYVTRRQNVSFARNRNTVRHTKRSLGSISQIVIVSMLTLVFGLIYVAEGTKATSFDYALSDIETEITGDNYSTNLSVFTELGEGAFYKCSSLTNVDLGSSLTYIPEANHGDYYLQQTLYIRQAENTNNATNLRIENVTITGAHNPIGDALRILFVATSSSGKTTTAHYNPRNDVGDNNGVEDAILFDTLLGDAQETITVQIYMYFDGTDAITYTSAINDATLNGQNIEIEFAIDELTYN